MAKGVIEEVPAAKAMFDKAKEILGYDLLNICLNG
jgi:[acyl-carrier-protein] S-malonyltransferase